jgi:tRNA U34 5-methylaminomethyl-2-thiouridine-forming methyltransferase MnmC
MPPTPGLDDVFPVRTLDGSETLYSRRFDATYHSLNGAVSESRHVFLNAGLKSQLHKPAICILEFGFGTGLNAFLAYLFSVTHNKPVHYTGIEAFPISREVARLLTYPEYLAAPDKREVFLQLHDGLPFTRDLFSFQLIDGYLSLASADLYDCIFFDAFAPDVDERVWTVDVFRHLFTHLNDGGCLVTYCAQGKVRRDMMSVGFEVERIPGAPGKRQMIRAWRRAVGL